MRRGLDIKHLLEVVRMLADDTPLPQHLKDHPLKGNYRGYRECHIEPDWLLIYEKREKVRILSLERTGTHADLFE